MTVPDAPIARRWKFFVEDENGDGYHVGPCGERNEDCEFVGTDREADAEADRRADLWEMLPGHGFALRVLIESQGRVRTADA